MMFSYFKISTTFLVEFIIGEKSEAISHIVAIYDVIKYIVRSIYYAFLVGSNIWRRYTLQNWDLDIDIINRYLYIP